MIHSTRVIGDATSVASRFGTTNGIVRPEKLLDVTCFNNTGGVLYMLVFELTQSLIPFGTKYDGGGAYTITGLTAGHTYEFRFGANDTTITDGASVITNGNPNTAPGDVGAGTLVKLAGTTLALAGSAGALITLFIVDVTAPQSTPVPAEGSTPMFSFPVQGGLGGTLGKQVDMAGIYCCWSSTQATKTIAAASGEINILLKG